MHSVSQPRNSAAPKLAAREDISSRGSGSTAGDGNGCEGNGCEGNGGGNGGGGNGGGGSRGGGDGESSYALPAPRAWTRGGRWHGNLMTASSLSTHDSGPTPAILFTSAPTRPTCDRAAAVRHTSSAGWSTATRSAMHHTTARGPLASDVRGCRWSRTFRPKCAAAQMPSMR